MAVGRAGKMWAGVEGGGGGGGQRGGEAVSEVCLP